MDHTKVYYSSYRKDFYVEVPELAKMTDEGTDCTIKTGQLWRTCIHLIELLLVLI